MKDNLQHASEVMNDSTVSEALVIRDIINVSVSGKSVTDFTISTGHSTTTGLNEFDCVLFCFAFAFFLN